MEQEHVNKIINAHKEWLKTDHKKGMCANLSWANLSGANLSAADLRGANLSWANLSGANLSAADLRGANLSWANLSGANLSGANLSAADLSAANLGGADLSAANLRGANMPEGIYTAGGAGSEQRYTYYDAINDRIICGCWDDAGGNHLDSFKKRIENIYGPDGEEPNPAHYKAYLAAIQYFEACREAYIVDA